MFGRFMQQSDPNLTQRMDPAYYHPAYLRLLECCALPLVPLGQFIQHITYGPIITGPRPDPVSAGVRIIHQGQIAPTGVDPREAVMVCPGSPWDLDRARLQPGDLVLARSGVAGVGRNRVAVFQGEYPAVVGSFVDLIRLRELDPWYVVLCLKTELVWAQVFRIINGVGTPNINFDEIAGLMLPLAPVTDRDALAREFRESVHPLHLEWLAGHEPAAQEAAHRLSQLIQTLDGMVLVHG